ncbi:MAG TPA: ATP-binding protein [Lacipirellulaceae bacterium]|jgi:signal transduction histidine kinase/CheY-like chemotaxis protein|nr:ATP-binding protein [Lacipirellulaceae bacterium]
MPTELERRILVHAPTSKDSELTCRVLREKEIVCVVCESVEALVRELERGVGTVILAEEAFLRDDIRPVAEFLERQPAWSDLPIVLVTRHGSDSPAVAEAAQLLGNVTLLERPTRLNALVSAAQAGLRARRRQFQARDLLLARTRAEESLKQADKRKDEFLATLAHELRNPLAPLRNSVNLLQLTASDDPATARLCEMMERQVNQLVRLVDDLLEVSRITRGKIELRKENVELATVARNAIETSRPVIDNAGVQLAITLPQEPVIVHGDPVRLGQVFSNLLNNAAKYTNAGGQIWFTARKESGEAVISIRDTGIGIAADVLPNVFDMFMQVDRATNRSQGGLGIGLTLVRSLVELHDGSVSVQSDGPGHGSEFTVRLPVVVEERRSARIAPSAGPVTAIQSRRILVVDDNVDSAKTLGMLLKYLGADVQVVNDGVEALAAVEKYRPDVVLLDIGMPGMDGYEVARRIRERKGFGSVTLIALTGWGQEEDRRRTREAGFDHHLVKPADIVALQSLLGTLD